MNQLTEKNIIAEMNCGGNLAYVLGDNKLFQPTGYKIMQNLSEGCFIKCMKALYNGKLQLYYLTRDYQPMSTLLSSLTPDRFVMITANIVADVMDVKSNGFLSCCNIDISLEHIYVDTSTYRVRLIYLPLGSSLFEDYSQFESSLRSSLVRLIEQTPSLASSKTAQLESELMNGKMSLEDLHSILKGSRSSSSQRPNPNSKHKDEEKPVHNAPRTLTLTATNAPMYLQFAINQDEFVLGRLENAVDGVISYNSTVGRRHCEINRSADGFTVTDLNSTNGTYVNHEKIQALWPCPLKDGDILNLASSGFKVSIK